jgi:hypothetical protein
MADRPFASLSQLAGQRQRLQLKERELLAGCRTAGAGASRPIAGPAGLSAHRWQRSDSKGPSSQQTEARTSQNPTVISPCPPGMVAWRLTRLSRWVISAALYHAQAVVRPRQDVVSGLVASRRSRRLGNHDLSEARRQAEERVQRIDATHPAVRQLVRALPP